MEKMMNKHEFWLSKNLYDANKCFVILDCLKLKKTAWQIYIKRAIFFYQCKYPQNFFFLSFLLLSRWLSKGQFQIHQKVRSHKCSVKCHTSDGEKEKKEEKRKEKEKETKKRKGNKSKSPLQTLWCSEGPSSFFFFRGGGVCAASCSIGSAFYAM